MRKIALLVAVAALTLAGCSQPINTAGPAPAPAEATTPAETGPVEGAPSEGAPSEEVPPADLDCRAADMETFQKWCAAEEGGDGEELEPVPAGVPFDYYAISGDDSEAPIWKVTLDKLSCGLKSIAEADSNPDWDGGDEYPQYIAAKPESGNEFCVAYWTWKNAGKVPGTTDFAGDIVLGEDERFAPSSEDQSRSWTVMETQLGVNYSKQINPRGTSKSLDIWQIPKGERPTGIWFPGQTMMSESYILVAAP